MEALKEHFRPEFLNRIDEIIMFHPLEEMQIRSIVDLQIERVQQRLWDKHITIDISARAKDWLGKKGFDPELGARPLKRVLQSELLDELAMQIIEGKINEGDTVKVDVDKEKLVIGKKRAETKKEEMAAMMR